MVSELYVQHDYAPVTEPVRRRGLGRRAGHRTPFSFQSLTLTYAVALLIIAALTISSHYVLSVTLRDTEGTAAVINMAGRQRMLSQRIAGLAAQRALGDGSADADLAAALGEFEAAHLTLSNPYRAEGTDSATRRLHALYFTGSQPLDAGVAGFVASARRLLQLAPGDPAATPLLAGLFREARAPLLDALNEATAIQQSESERRVSKLQWLQSTILALVLATLVIEAMVIFRPMISRIMRQFTEIVELATTDALTGLANRRSFLEQWGIESAVVARHGGSMSLLILDVDYFKQVNDTRGHATGDAVLRDLAAVILGVVRAADRVGRLGGEEFGVLLPQTGRAGAIEVAERIRSAVEARAVGFGEDQVRVTVSVGVAVMDGAAEPIETLLQRADAQMYRAKAAGRNMVMAGA